MAPPADPRTLALGLAGIRLGIGGVLTVAPQFGARLWIGPDTGGPGTRVLARALGARDVVLGYRTLRAVQQGEPVAGWLQIGAMADTADVVAGLIAMRGLPGHRRFTMPLIAGAVGAACFWAARQGFGDAQDAAEATSPEQGVGEGPTGWDPPAAPVPDDVLDLDELAPDALPEDRVLGGDQRPRVGLDAHPAESDELDAEEAATLLEVTADRIDVLVADGLLVPVGDGARRFRREDVLAVRIVGG